MDPTSADEKSTCTIVRPGRMKNGGFSTTSWPMLTTQSASSIARCTKSPPDRAAVPRKRGCVSSTTPLPIWVLKNGMPVRSMSALSAREVLLRFAPAPSMSRGRRATEIASIARATAPSSATDRRAKLGAIGARSVVSRATSSGSSRWTAPGRSSCARRNASRTRAATESADTMVCVYLVRGRIIGTTSTSWNCPCLLVRIGFWPVIISIGIAPSSAYAAAVTRFVAPGPSVDRHTPALPVRRPHVAAMIPAACSCRVTTKRMREPRRDSRRSRFSSPGSPNMVVTPSASSDRTNSSEAFMPPSWGRTRHRSNRLMRTRR